MKMGKPLWAKSVITRSFVMALIFFVASSGALFMGDSFAKYYTQKRAEEAAIVASFILEDDVATSNLTMNCAVANLDTKGTAFDSDDEYFVDWRIKVSNTNAQGKISTIKTEYSFIVDLPDDAPEYLSVFAEGNSPAFANQETKTYTFLGVGVLRPGEEESQYPLITFAIPKHRMSRTEELIDGAYQWVGGDFALADVSIALHAEQIQGGAALPKLPTVGALVEDLPPWGVTANNAASYANTFISWNYESEEINPFTYTQNTYSGGVGISADLSACTEVGTGTDHGYLATYFIPGLQEGQTYELRYAYKNQLTNARFLFHSDFNYVNQSDYSQNISNPNMEQTDVWRVRTLTFNVRKKDLVNGLFAVRFDIYQEIGLVMGGTCAFEILSVAPARKTDGYSVELMSASAKTFSADTIQDCGWTPWMENGSLASYAIDKTQNYGNDGTYSYKMQNTSRTNQSTSLRLTNLVVGKKYKVTVAIKTEGVYTSGRGVGPRVDFGPVVNSKYQADFYLGTWLDISEDNNNYQKIEDAGWQVYTQEFVAINTTYTFCMRLWGSYGTMWVDNFSVTAMP